jgi:hypothetical protein
MAISPTVFSLDSSFFILPLEGFEKIEFLAVFSPRRGRP